MGLANPSVNAEAFSARLWFAVYTACRHEKKVSQHLSLRAIEHYLPLYRSERKWRDGSRVTLDLPLFPGYLFVRMRMTKHTVDEGHWVRFYRLSEVCLAIHAAGVRSATC